jgi:nicotinate-nucleotide adenylyltransferase
MQVGLYFGSFNPIHIGHLIIANFVAQTAQCDKVWFVVSPQNPFKPAGSLLNEYHRLHLVRLGTEDNHLLSVSDVEFKSPRPSYTIDTLTYLSEKYPQHTFKILLGSDSYQNIDRWKNALLLIKHYPLLVYERPGFKVKTPTANNATLLTAPFLDISATMIREMIKAKKSVQYLLPEPVRLEIEKNNYYRL